MTGIGEEPQVSPTRRYSVNETCAMLGIHRNTLRRMTAAGGIRVQYLKAGSRLRPCYLGRDILRCWRGAAW